MISQQCLETVPTPRVSAFIILLEPPTSHLMLQIMFSWLCGFQDCLCIVSIHPFKDLPIGPVFLQRRGLEQVVPWWTLELISMRQDPNMDVQQAACVVFLPDLKNRSFEGIRFRRFRRMLNMPDAGLLVHGQPWLTTWFTLRTDLLYFNYMFHFGLPGACL